ncbi:MAG: alpha/beta hydrolase [Azospirillaceae bacterium]
MTPATPLDLFSHVPEIVTRLDQAAQHVETLADGIRVHWRIWGSGPCLILLHGSGGSWLHWIANIEPLARSYRVVVPDIPGHGDSDAPPPPPTSEHLAALLSTGAESVFGDGPISIVGFSMGASIAVDLAASQDDRVSALVLVGCGKGFAVQSADYGPLVRWRRLSDPGARLTAHRNNLETLMLRHAHLNDDLALYAHASSVERGRLRYQRDADGGRFLDLMRNFKGRLAAIWGEFDAVMGPYRREREDFVRSLKPDADLIFIPNAGHWVQYERALAFERALGGILSPSL